MEVLNNDTQALKNNLKEWLPRGKVKVVFTKKDGTLRTMLCTTSSLLAQDYEKKTDRTKTTNEDVCPVFDLEKNEWRSFRYDSISSVEVLSE